VRQNPEELRRNTYLAIATYIAAGIDPEAATLFVQSHVSEHAELGWILTCFSGMGELSRMTQFKDKSAKQSSEAIPTGIFVYPTLMAADILLYRTHLVPVGEDQKQHLEITRDLAERVNKHVGREVFVVPDIYTPPVGARIMSLQNPESKMSKSDPTPGGVVFLSDSDDEIKKKFKRSVTDSLPAVAEKDLSPGVTNLLSIQAAITGKAMKDVHAAYVGRQYGYLKVETGDCVIEALRPIRQRTQELLSDLPALDALLKRGADRARERARRTLDDVYQGVGFLPRR
jgi:tryptophanyl-tRNA synthetase